MRTLLFILLLTLPISLFATSKEKKISTHDKNADVKECYYVNSNDSSIKNGTYVYSYQNKEQVRGQYLDNLKTGKWIYTPTSDFKIIGSYLNDLKSGKWYYIESGDTLAILSYSEGKLHCKQKGFYKNGRVASEIIYDKGLKDGVEKKYYDNGSIKEIISYEDNLLHGTSTAYLRDGNPIYKVNYFKDNPMDYEQMSDSVFQYYHRGELKSGTGYLKSYTFNAETQKVRLVVERNYTDSLLNGKIVGCDFDGDTAFVGLYKNGFRVGSWKFSSYNGKIDHEKLYLLSDSIINDPSEKSTKDYNDRYVNVDRLSSFSGGNSELSSFISRTLKYPKECQLNGVQGKVYIGFNVSTTGEVIGINVARGVHPALDAEAVRVVKLLPYWTPGFVSGIPVTVSFTIPLNFVLTR